MEHFYHDVVFAGENFIYHDLYRAMVYKFPSGSKFVEAGLSKGKSTAFLGIEIINSNRNIALTSIGELSEKEFVFLKNNLEPLQTTFNLAQANPITYANNIEDASLDFVFVNSHNYETCEKNILAYLPKIKVGGVIAGNNFHGTTHGVVEAVDDLLGFNHISPWYYLGDSCWFYDVKCKY